MTKARTLKLALLLVMAATLAGMTAGSLPGLPAVDPSQRSGAPQAGGVSNEDCAVCHDDLAKAFANNPHRVLENSKHFELKNSCESCHGPGEEHVSSGGETDKIVTFKGDSAGKANQMCLDCHKKDHELSDFRGSKHARQGLNCTDCHSVHTGAMMTRLLTKSSNDLCLECHTERRADFSKPYRHRVTENAIRCTDCHRPHSSADVRQLRSGFSGDQPCLNCHSEKEGPFVYEHAVLRIRNCQSCHEPHGSNNPKMLVRSTVGGLCLECHTSSAGILGSQPPSIHDLRQPRWQNCTTCHVTIHGSNSSRIFIR